MRMLCFHGWGFDGTIWDALSTHLAGWDIIRRDRGYFRQPASPEPNAPFLAVTHSIGTMHFLMHPPPGCIGLIAINGFDRFAATRERPGVPKRIIDRMIAGMDRDPGAVLTQFRMRCGADPHAANDAGMDADLLRRDLILLRDGACSMQAMEVAFPIVVLHGSADPLLNADHRESLFETAGNVRRITVDGGGHLLPLTHADLCAQACRDLVDTVS